MLYKYDNKKLQKSMEKIGEAIIIIQVLIRGYKIEESEIEDNKIEIKEYRKETIVIEIEKKLNSILEDIEYIVNIEDSIREKKIDVIEIEEGVYIYEINREIRDKIEEMYKIIYILLEQINIIEIWLREKIEILDNRVKLAARFKNK